jgi:hypothetical protein
MKNNALLILVIISIIVVWLLTPYFVPLLMSNCKDYSSLGQFGDMFGVVNVLFSGVTLVFLVYTLKQSNEERKINAYQRYEDNFFKLLDLHRGHFQDLKDSFANFENDNILSINAIPNSSWEEGYQTNFEQKHVIKNFVNYLLTFDYIVNTIASKKELTTRAKYFKLYFSQLHVNEKRFLLYHFNLGSKKPANWKEAKTYLFEGLSRGHLMEKIRNHPFEGLSD